MDADADGLERDAVLEGEGVERQCVCGGYQGVDLLERDGFWEVRLEGLQAVRWLDLVGSLVALEELTHHRLSSFRRGFGCRCLHCRRH